MSHYMTALAMKQRGLKPAAKIVLYWLADHHNGETGKCFPSLARLCECAEMGKTALLGHLDALEDMGLIERVKLKRDDGGWSSTSYIMHLQDPLVRKTDNPCSESEPPLVRNTDTNLGNNNLGKEPSIIHQAFADFWAMYPRKVGRTAAEKAFAKAAKKASTDDIIFGLSQQRAILAEKDTQFIPHAATWINQERWNDNVDDLGRPSEARPARNRGGHDSLLAGFAQYASRQSD